MLEELAVIVTEIVVTAAMIEAMIEGAMTGVMIGAMVVVAVVDTEEVVEEVEENLAGWQSEIFFSIRIYSITCLKQPLKNRQNKDLNDK